MPQKTDDLSLLRGAAPPVTFALSTSDPATGLLTPLSLAGATATLIISWADGQIQKATSNGTLVLNGAAGTVVWQSTGAETLTLPLGRTATYALKVIGADSTPRSFSGCIVAFAAANAVPPAANAPVRVGIAVDGATSGSPADVDAAIAAAKADAIAQAGRVAFVQSLIFG